MQASSQVRSRWPAVCVLIAAVSYQSWVLALVLPHDAAWRDGYVSEFAALSERYGPVYRTFDAITGVLLAAAAITLARRVDHSWTRPRLARAGWIGLAVFGLATVTDALWPMSCSPTAVPGCATPMQATDLMHVVSSSLVGLGTLLALVELGMRRQRGVRRWVAGVAVVLVAATGLQGALSDAGLVPATGLGIVQRIGLVATSTWMVLLAVELLTRSSPRLPSSSEGDEVAPPPHEPLVQQR